MKLAAYGCADPLSSSSRSDHPARSVVGRSSAVGQGHDRLTAAVSASVSGSAVTEASVEALREHVRRLAQAGRHAEALAAARLQPGAIPLNYFGILHAELRQYPEASCATHHAASTGLIHTVARRPRPRQAAAAFTTALKLHPEDSSLWGNHGNTLFNAYINQVA